MSQQSALANAIGESLRRRIVGPNQVQSQGGTLEFHSSTVCDVYYGVVAAVQRVNISGGLRLEDVEEIVEGQRVLDFEHADAVFARIAPGMPQALRRPLIANVIGNFDRNAGLARVDATVLLFQSAEVFERWRMPVPSADRLRPVVQNGIARMGRGRWWAGDSNIPRLRDITLSHREVRKIRERREELLCSSN